MLHFLISPVFYSLLCSLSLSLISHYIFGYVFFLFLLLLLPYSWLPHNKFLYIPISYLICSFVLYCIVFFCTRTIHHMSWSVPTENNTRDDLSFLDFNFHFLLRKVGSLGSIKKVINQQHTIIAQSINIRKMKWLNKKRIPTYSRQSELVITQTRIDLILITNHTHTYTHIHKYIRIYAYKKTRHYQAKRGI